MIEINGLELAMLTALMNTKNAKRVLGLEEIRAAWELWVDCDAFLERKSTELEADSKNGDI